MSTRNSWCQVKTRAKNKRTKKNLYNSFNFKTVQSYTRVGGHALMHTGVAVINSNLPYSSLTTVSMLHKKKEHV